MDSYSIGEKIDLDNDGENELIICGPYGGIYLDARNDKVYEFAAGDGAVKIRLTVDAIGILSVEGFIGTTDEPLFF